MSKIQQEYDHPIDVLVESITEQCRATTNLLAYFSALEGPPTVEQAKVMESLNAVNVSGVNMVERLVKLDFISNEEPDDGEENDDEEEEEEEEVDED